MNRAVDALRLQLQQLQGLHERGEIGAEALAEARAPLERELVDQILHGDDADVPASKDAAPARPSRRMQLGLSALVLVLAVVGYVLTGSPEYARGGPAVAAGAGPSAVAATGDSAVDEAQMQEMVQRLADRLQEKPDDAVGWTILARAYAAMGRYNLAAPAFRKALEVSGESADLLADYADSLAALEDGKLVGEPMKLVQRALVLEPNNLKALALSGSAAFDERDYAAAVRQWEQVERALPADSNVLSQVRASIAQARELGGLPAAAAASGVPAASKP